LSALACYFLLHVFEENNPGPTPLPRMVVVMLAIWCILLALGALPALMLTGMAFEGGHTLDAYLSLVAIWSYPPLVGVAYFYRRRRPGLVWLPVLTVFLFIIEQLAWQFGLRIKFSN
jgi:hypothetical protein